MTERTVIPVPAGDSTWWDPRDEPRERQRSIPWCKTHRLPLDFLRDDGKRGFCDAGGSLECEVGVVWEVIDE